MSDNALAYKQLSASGVVKNRGGSFTGFIGLATGSGIVTFYDNASAASGTVLAGPISVTAGQVFNVGECGMQASNGIYMQLVSGTATVNVLFR